jgi:hypothetical protein
MSMTTRLGRPPASNFFPGEVRINGPDVHDGRLVRSQRARLIKNNRIGLRKNLQVEACDPQKSRLKPA